MTLPRWVSLAVVAFIGLPPSVAAGPPDPLGGAAYIPAGLAVDTAGNGVLDPSEIAVVAPAWTNFCSCMSGISGSASSFTGPPGPVYTITDNIADYGVLQPFSTGSCTATGNCFGVQVTAATRPVTHWDSTVFENVGLNSKTWRLHIGASFTDVATSNGFYRFVETILHKNVTGGCGAGLYCPTAATTREQMAVFVLVAREPAGYLPPACGATPLFTDVPVTSPFCRWVEELYRRNVVGGCGTGIYCPSNPATREQMAIFVLRTLDPTINPLACTIPMFADVPAASPFCRYIEELVRRGVVTGCGGGNYCPTANVSREQMSVFLAVTFGLTLYGV